MSRRLRASDVCEVLRRRLMCSWCDVEIAPGEGELRGGLGLCDQCAADWDRKSEAIERPAFHSFFDGIKGRKA